MRKRITLLGATGSIGKAALDVLERHAERYELFALAVHRNVDGALEAARRFRPRYAVVADAAALDGRADEFREAGCEVLAGPEALEYVAAHDETDTVVSAIVGAAALKP
ncbi:MAG: 1-deoxy-D-xylulose-5-phosphate reductoisomerase, partial [Planctomycetota bacterium]